MPQLDPNVKTPYYEQLRTLLLENIQHGVYLSGAKIPSEHQLCRQFGVSRVTVRKALQGLTEEGVLVKRHGKGTFVAAPVVVEKRAEHRSFTASCLEMGKKPGTHLVSRKVQKVKKDLAQLLNGQTDQGVLCIKRVRLVDETPVIFEIDYFSAGAADLLEADVEHIPLLEVLRQYRPVHTLHFVETFEVQFANREQARSLNCPINTPLLGVRQVVSDELGVVYVNDQFIRSDIYKYVTES